MLKTTKRRQCDCHTSSHGGTYTFFGGSSVQQLWNESTIHLGRGRIQRLRFWSLQTPCLEPILSLLFETICLDHWHSTHVNDIWSKSVNWPQLSIRVSWYHGDTGRYKTQLFQWVKSKEGRCRYLSTESHGHSNRCDNGSLKSKSLLRKGSSKWTGVSWWCTWHCADQRYEETAKADNRHPSPRESFERTRLTDKNVWSRTRRSRPRRHSIQGTPTYHSRDIRIRASWKDQHTKNCKKWYA